MVYLDGIEFDLRKQLDGQTDSMKVLNIAYLHSNDLLEISKTTINKIMYSRVLILRPLNILKE